MYIIATHFNISKSKSKIKIQGPYVASVALMQEQNYIHMILTSRKDTKQLIE